jgi:signal transduction histidine kinase
VWGMSSKIAKPAMHSAAWRISCWATVAFAVGTLGAFVFLHRFVASDIQRRSDAWLSGEVEVLGDVAERTPKDALYGRVVSEVAELAAREVPNKLASEDSSGNTVFFLQTGDDGSMQLWVGAGDGQADLKAIEAAKMAPDRPTDVRVAGFPIPFRVASIQISDKSHIYLGLSERDELRVLNKLRLRFFLLWLALVLLGFGIVFYTTRRMLSHIRKITEAASRIGHSDLNARVPTSRRNDEVSQLALTLNRMLDRIESSMHQLHTITDSLAHDLRSPLTAIRGKLEMSLPAVANEEQAEPIVSAIEELDRLTDFLNKSLDVAEARADALRLARSEVDLSELLRTMIDLYEPSMSEKGLGVALQSDRPAKVLVDAALLHRMIANLLDNELKHLPYGRKIAITVRNEGDAVEMVLEDNGPGFDAGVLQHVFARRVKGRDSDGHGLGLAFVDAVVRAHGGSVDASNREGGGAEIRITLPMKVEKAENYGAAVRSKGEVLAGN